MTRLLVAAAILSLLAACRAMPKLEEDARYVRLATVVEIREFTEVERQQARASRPVEGGTGVGVNVGVGTGTHGTFGGVMVGIGSVLGGGRDLPPQIADGANRVTVQPLGSIERIEVMSFANYKVGDCVKVLAGHPKAYPRFFELKPGERCEQSPPSPH